MQKQNILFNLDDTLAQCNIYFNRVIEQYVDHMAEWFSPFEKEQFRQKQLEIDMKSVDENGLTTEHFPQSFVDAYLYFCDLTGQMKEVERIELLRNLAKSVFEIPVEPLPDMYETLEELKEAGHELYLHTGGDEANQRRKIAQLELAAYFDNRIFISMHKDRTALADILNTMKFDPNRTWMVGNSLKTDILPGLELGINTIYIPAQTEWQYNMVDVTVEPKGAFFTLQSLKEVPSAIRQYVEKEVTVLKG